MSVKERGYKTLQAMGCSVLFEAMRQGSSDEDKQCILHSNEHKPARRQESAGSIAKRTGDCHALALYATGGS